MSRRTRALRAAALRRLLGGRPRPDLTAQRAAFCECETTDEGHVAGPDGVCLRCGRPMADASPFSVPPIESGYPFRRGPARDW